MDKDCMFQYATNYEIIEDTDLISKDEAVALWHKHKEDFIKRFENGEDPEMCIWVNCDTNTSYGKSIMHVDHNSIVKDGDIYEIVKVG